MCAKFCIDRKGKMNFENLASPQWGELRFLDDGLGGPFGLVFDGKSRWDLGWQNTPFRQRKDSIASDQSQKNGNLR